MSLLESPDESSLLLSLLAENASRLVEGHAVNFNGLVVDGSAVGDRRWSSGLLEEHCEEVEGRQRAWIVLELQSETYCDELV